MPPDKAKRRPGQDGARTTQPSSPATIPASTGSHRPPLAPASVFAPGGRRRRWWYTYPCRTCGSFHFGVARDLDGVTGVRKAPCGHKVTLMIAKTYGATA